MAGDSSDIDNALTAKLGADTTLLSLMPHGVYMTGDVPPKATKFVEVSLITSFDEHQFESRAFEVITYQVKAVELKPPSGAGDIKAAAARIDALLDPQPPAAPATLTVAGFSLMSIRRVARVRDTEPDEQDETIRWHHRGGRYEVFMST